MRKHAGKETTTDLAQASRIFPPFALFSCSRRSWVLRITRVGWQQKLLLTMKQQVDSGLRSGAISNFG